ncbi:MAG TPA: diguanylate cyclase [Burkholderiales bacterium]|nr:diguanylate cyclase [Burkholderiales bacterium]
MPRGGLPLPKILIVDDSDTIRAVLAGAVRAMKFEPLLADCGETALELFVAEKPALVLLDVNMPGIDGYETARRIRAALPDEWVPIIFLSASEFDQDLERAIESGGDDYLVKPVSAVVLSAKIRALQRLDHMRRKLLDVSSELTAANQRLEALSHQDGLTGIANRRAFDFLLERQFAEAARRRNSFSVVLCDVDHFKAYNDHYGHVAGDECLRKVAAAFARSCKRTIDVAARYGGEEFALLLPDTPSAGALHVAEVARAEVAALDISHAHSPTSHRVTFSAGIATYEPERDKVSSDLTTRADEALYRAKDLGRDRTLVA